jgi:hypothetical protein
MKKILFLFGVLAIGFTGCKNCGTCEWEMDIPQMTSPVTFKREKMKVEYCGKDWRTAKKNYKENPNGLGDGTAVYYNYKCKGNGLF